jgi:hypothetical protein
VLPSQPPVSHVLALLPSQPPVWLPLALVGAAWLVYLVAFVAIDKLVDELGYAIGWLLVRYRRLAARAGSLIDGDGRRARWGGVGAYLDTEGRSLFG